MPGIERRNGGKGPMKRVAVLAVLIAAGFATILGAMVVFEESLIFFPTRYPVGRWEVERVGRGIGCVISDRWFSTDDGVRLHGWWLSPVGEIDGGPVLLFFHGNAGNLSDRAELAAELATRVGARVFILGYRGYGRSDGRPSEEGLYRDARAAWYELTGPLGVSPERIVVFGKSLGGAVAVDLVEEVEPAGLIVESSFTSIPDMAAIHYPFVPKGVIRTRLDSLSKIPKVDCPKLFIHSPADEVVPYRLGRQLYDAAREPKRFHEVVGAGHNETWLVGGADYFRAIRDFVASVAAGPHHNGPE
jgi:fermentation-respiration switch protein FrsA (DUF1100 family)